MTGFQPNTESQPETRAKLTYGTYEETDALFVGMTIAQARYARAGAWSIPTEAKAFRGSAEVGADYTIVRGDSIEFIKRQGDKG